MYKYKRAVSLRKEKKKKLKRKVKKIKMGGKRKKKKKILKEENNRWLSLLLVVGELKTIRAVASLPTRPRRASDGPSFFFSTDLKRRDFLN
jgi:hypothetical protein